MKSSPIRALAAQGAAVVERPQITAAFGVATRSSEIVTLASGVSSVERFDAPSILAITSGSAECRLWGDDFRVIGSLSRGALVLLPADYAFRLDLDRPCLAMRIELRSCPGDAWMDFAGILGRVFRDAFAFQTVIKIFEESAEYQRGNGEKLLDCAHNVLRASLTVQSRRAKIAKRKRACNGLDVSKAARVIEEKLDQKLTISDLAEELGTTEWSFMRRFKEAYHVTPHRYILDLRLDKAKQLLNQGAIPLAAVAYECGFSSQAHMTTVFGNYCGVTPGRFRAKARKLAVN